MIRNKYSTINLSQRGDHTVSWVKWFRFECGKRSGVCINCQRGLLVFLQLLFLWLNSLHFPTFTPSWEIPRWAEKRNSKVKNTNDSERIMVSFPLWLPVHLAPFKTRGQKPCAHYYAHKEIQMVYLLCHTLAHIHQLLVEPGQLCGGVALVVVVPCSRAALEFLLSVWRSVQKLTQVWSQAASLTSLRSVTRCFGWCFVVYLLCQGPQWCEEVQLSVYIRATFPLSATP